MIKIKIVRASILLYFCLALGFLSTINCNNDEPITAPTEANLVLKSFIFEKKNNPHLSEDVVFEIKNNIISGKLKNYFFKSVPTFTTNAQVVEIDNSKQTSGSSAVDFRKPITYNLKSASGKNITYTVNVTWDDALAHIYFTTNGGLPVVSKDEYLPGVLRINGQMKYENMEVNSQIKSRGNTTWLFPKKPYKIKLDENASVLGLASEKQWVLLADYLDGTHLLNAVAFKIGHLLKMPYTNTIIPVEVTINNEYKGLYNLTEQVEVKTNRINVGKDGVLLELDRNFDEEWQFKSAIYNLPVMVKNPKVKDAEQLATIKNDFETLEALVAHSSFPNNDYLNYIDDVSIANYLMVYMFTLNEEINHPKSTYIHKTATGKYIMGPLWDFDWAYGYEGTFVHFNNFDKNLFWTPPSKGTQFFEKFLSDPKIKALIKKQWNEFRTIHFSELMDYIDEYAFITKGAKLRNATLWPSNNVKDVEKLKQWLNSRATYMDAFTSSF
jgi:hypothetical protein